MRAANPSPSALRNATKLSQHARPQCLRTPFRITRWLATPARPSPPRRTLDPITLHRLQAERDAYYKRRSYYAAIGMIFGMTGIWVTAHQVDLPPKPAKADSRTNEPLVAIGKEKKVIVQKLGEEPEEISDEVATGTSKVPTFPRVIEFDDEGDSGMVRETAGVEAAGTEYQLVGLGIRTVSFLGIEVYVVGMYVATEDMDLLEKHMIRRIDNVATTLVPSEREKLRALLLDPEKSEETWSEVLKESKVRSIIRVVPTRDTDFAHMRDAWVRHLGARSKKDPDFADESFGKSVADFKALWRVGKSVPKGKELLLSRDHDGKFVAWYDDGKTGAIRLGEVKDERVSRGLWLNYLGGKNVASESARKNIVDGVLELVERPVGTIATQVQPSKMV